MSCERFEDRLDDYLDGCLSDVERRAAEDHLRGCAACRTLVETLRATLGTLAPSKVASAAAAAGDPDLAATILSRTSGAACGRAQSLLCDLAAGTLGSEEVGLVESHLGHCARCAALQRTLAWVETELPQMARIEPDSALTTDILQATAGLRIRTPRWWTVLGDAIVSHWRSLVARPRFAWEVAYIGTVVLVLLFGTSISPFQGVPKRALAIVHGDPRGATTVAVSELKSLHSQVGAAGTAAWDATGGRAGRGVRSHAAVYAERHPGMPEAWTGFSLHAGDLRRAVASRNLASTGLILGAMQDDLGALWRSFKTPNAAVGDSTPSGSPPKP